MSKICATINQYSNYFALICLRKKKSAINQVQEFCCGDYADRQHRVGDLS